MVATVKSGARKYSLTVDEEGYREYSLTILVECDPGDGPFTVYNTPGLPVPGEAWLIDNDIDLWVWCRRDVTVTPLSEKEYSTEYEVTFKFSNKPQDKDKEKCQDHKVEDPLLEPQKISGNFTKDKLEVTTDRFGMPILTSSHEVIRGPGVEFDQNRLVVKIEQNVPLLQLTLLRLFIDTVNDRPLWGFPARSIKLSSINFERKFHGSCYLYYTRQLEFEVGPVDWLGVPSWDREVLDEGTKVLHGHWNLNTGSWVLDPIRVTELGGGLDPEIEMPDPDNPSHFDRFKDRNGEIAKVILNSGLPASADIGSGTIEEGLGPGGITIEYYRESNFLLLGIPTSF